MGITNYTGLLALLGIPAIIVLYMLKPKHHNRTVSSTWLWQQVFDEIEAASRLHRLRQSLLMFLEILSVLLIALILAGLYVNRYGEESHVIVILDGSVSMQAQDQSPNRFELAKEGAVDYVAGLNDDRRVTLVFLGDVPQVMVRDEGSASVVTGAIKQLQVTDGRWEMDVLTETLEGLLADQEASVVYFGDRQVPGTVSYSFAVNTKNYGVYDLTWRAYPELDTLAVMAEVFNTSEIDGEVMVSLYADGYYFSSRELVIKGGGSGQVLFGDLPQDVFQLTLVIDEEDSLTLDNRASTFVKQPGLKKVAYVSQGNVFLEKMLQTQAQLEVYQIKPENVDGALGYDLYVFDGVAAAEAPVDGSVLYINPPENSGFNRLGYSENPLVFPGVSHVMTAIDRTDFNLVSTQVFEAEKDYESIFETAHGPIAYFWQEGSLENAVIGFDLRYSDLPLSVIFPIVMTGIFERLTVNTMTDTGSAWVGDSVVIRIYPGTEKAWVIDPSGHETSLALDKGSVDFSRTDAIGAYTIYQEQGGVIEEESFYINVPPEGDGREMTGVRETTAGRTYETKEMIRDWMGLGLLTVLLANWLLYTHRRRRYAYKH